MINFFVRINEGKGQRLLTNTVAFISLYVASLWRYKIDRIYN